MYPELHINYQGQKKDNLASVITHLVDQAGAYDNFVDVFGGSGAASFAVNRNDTSSYIFNDLDLGMCCLYHALADNNLFKRLITNLLFLQEDLANIKNHRRYRYFSKTKTYSLNNLGRTSSVHPLVSEFEIDFNQEVSDYYSNMKRKSNQYKGLYRQSESIVDTGNIYEIALDFVDILLANKENPIYNDFLTKYFPDIENQVSFNNSLLKNLEEQLVNLKVFNIIWSFIEHQNEIYKFCEQMDIQLAPISYRWVGSNGEEITEPCSYEEYDDKSLQYRFFQWYIYFTNRLNDKDFVESAWKEHSTKQVIVAMAEIMRWSLLTSGNADLSVVYRMIREDGGRESTEWIEFTNKDFPKIITNLHHLIQDNTRVENLSCFDVIKKYNSRDTLFFSDYPYENSKGYSVGNWTSNDSRNLIDSLIASDSKFIFACRASLKIKDIYTKDLEEIKQVNREVYEDVFEYFNNQMGSSLYATYININGGSLTLQEALQQHKFTEIMITNYPVQQFNSDFSTTMTYKEFMNILDTYLVM